MTTLAAQSTLVRMRMRLLGWLRDLDIGTLLCLSPLTALLVLGWQTRSMAARIQTQLGQPSPSPGWLIGQRGSGWVVRLFGGVAANIRTGIVAATGLALITLPFTGLWLGAWWAGWENSFNKGYEQASIGPLTWFLGAFIALPILAHLPLALAHASAEGRLGAFLEWRRIRSIFAAAGWRVVWLALLSVALSVPFFGLRALPVFVEGIVPAFADMTTEEQLQVAQGFDLAGAALAFVLILFLRNRAAAVYSLAAPRAARGRSASHWDGHWIKEIAPRGRESSRLTAALWLLLACVIWEVRLFIMSHVHVGYIDATYFSL